MGVPWRERRDPCHARGARTGGSPTELNPLTVVLAIIGAGCGLLADRLATRWPSHDEPEEYPPDRPIGWRTAVTTGIGAVSFGALPDRYPDAAELGLFVAWFAVLLILLATDLDQHLLPDLITLPLIPIAAVLAVVGPDPLTHDLFGFIGAVGVAIALPLGLFVLSIPFGAGAIAMGDLKLLVGIGLLTGLVRTLIGVMTGTFIVGIALVALIATRRVTLRSYVPFGPMLIIGAMWGVLVRFD